LEEILAKREKVANLYNERLKGIKEIKIPYVAPEAKISWFVYVIRLDEKRFSKKDRDQIIHLLEGKGINCRDYFPSIHLQKFYKESFGYKPGDFPITEAISDLTIALPFYNNLSIEEIDYIYKNLRDIIQDFSK
jgi:perosamine synthetase